LDNLYKIFKSNNHKIIIKLTNNNHSVFKAHFPGNPILPGFLQIDIIANILNDEIISIKYSKFIAHIYPNDEIVYNIKTNDNQRVIKIQKDNKKISEIKYEYK
jgi:3-hydroxyacyl-[acyl-carrier-protein] dehydratase